MRRKVIGRKPRNTRALARQLFPQWPRRMQAKWVVARLKADRLPPKFGKLIPLYPDQVKRGTEQFTPRTMKEAKR